MWSAPGMSWTRVAMSVSTTITITPQAPPLRIHPCVREKIIARIGRGVCENTTLHFIGIYIRFDARISEKKQNYTVYNKSSNLSGYLEGYVRLYSGLNIAITVYPFHKLWSHFGIYQAVKRYRKKLYLVAIIFSLQFPWIPTKNYEWNKKLFSLLYWLYHYSDGDKARNMAKSNNIKRPGMEMKRQIGDVDFSDSQLATDWIPRSKLFFLFFLISLDKELHLLIWWLSLLPDFYFNICESLIKNTFRSQFYIWLFPSWVPCFSMNSLLI